MKTVTCESWRRGEDQQGVCVDGHFSGQPSPGKCSRCPHYVAVLGATARIVTVEVAKSDTIAMCRERLTEEWGAEWQGKILAAASKVTDKRIYLSRAFYDEAIAHRR